MGLIDYQWHGENFSQISLENCLSNVHRYVMRPLLLWNIERALEKFIFKEKREAMKKVKQNRNQVIRTLRSLIEDNKSLKNIHDYLLKEQG